MRLEAPAKINIGLIVGNRREDGFHDIETIMARISLFDIIDAELSDSPSLSVSIKGNTCYLTSGEDLMEKAARVFSARTGIVFQLDVSIDKRIPHGTGLGGGSSDAASILLFLNEMTGYPLCYSELLETASEIGSDVPFFVSPYRGAFVRGRGEVVEECYVPTGKRLLLFFPDSPTSTASAYTRIDSVPRKERHLLSLSDSFPTRETHPNDFELVSPLNIYEVIPQPLFASDSYISLSGSGSAWFVLFRDGIITKFDNPEKYGIVSAYII